MGALLFNAHGAYAGQAEHGVFECGVRRPSGGEQRLLGALAQLFVALAIAPEKADRAVVVDQFDPWHGLWHHDDRVGVACHVAPARVGLHLDGDGVLADGQKALLDGQVCLFGGLLVFVLYSGDQRAGWDAQHLVETWIAGEGHFTGGKIGLVALDAQHGDDALQAGAFGGVDVAGLVDQVELLVEGRHLDRKRFEE